MNKHQRYNASEKGKARARKYTESEKGKAVHSLAKWRYDIKRKRDRLEHPG
jgi:hypothetical protein